MIACDMTFVGIEYVSVPRFVSTLYRHDVKLSDFRFRMKKMDGIRVE